MPNWIDLVKQTHFTKNRLYSFYNTGATDQHNRTARRVRLIFDYSTVFLKIYTWSISNHWIDIKILRVCGTIFPILFVELLKLGSIQRIHFPRCFNAIRDFALGIRQFWYNDYWDSFTHPDLFSQQPNIFDLAYNADDIVLLKICKACYSSKEVLKNFN